MGQQQSLLLQSFDPPNPPYFIFCILEPIPAPCAQGIVAFPFGKKKDEVRCMLCFVFEYTLV